jgi:hypothetical protein
MARGLVHQTVGVSRFGDAGKIRNVGKQDGDFLPRSASSVDMEPSMIPLTLSFGTRRAKDQMLRWATAIVLPSSSISATRM